MNSSGLCDSTKCLANVTHFTQYRYFMFSMREEDTEDDVSTECHVKVGSKDDWRAFRVSKGKNRGFLVKEPALTDTPPTTITPPTGEEEVTKRINSEEYRINNLKKLRELRELKDRVFTPRTDRFHWDLSDCFELSDERRSRHEGHEDQDADVEEGSPQQRVISPAELVANDYEYATSSLVAVRSQQDDGAPFWLGKILTCKKDPHGKVSRLVLHWLQLDAGANLYDGRYTLSYLQPTRNSRRTAWKSDVSADSVMVNFERLTKRNRLPVAVQKHLRQDLS